MPACCFNAAGHEGRTTMSTKYCPLQIIMLAALLPALQTLVSIHLELYPTITYPLMKGLMILLPLVAWFTLGRSRKEICEEIGLKKTRLLPGLLVGAAMAAGIIGFCTVTGIHRQADSSLLVTKLEKLQMIDYYWPMAVVISFANALFEEYYWRGFLVGQSRTRTNKFLLCAAGGLFFGIHHVFATLWMGNPALVATAVAATVIAGGVWTWMRIKGISVIDCYVSHLVADLAVFYIGYEILQEAIV